MKSKFFFASVMSAFLGFSTSSFADETLIQTAQLFYRIGLGGLTSTQVADVAAHGLDITSGGMLAKLNTAKRTIVGAVIAHDSKIAECEDVPATGSFVDSKLDATITFAAPSVTAPAGYQGYDKRIEAVAIDGNETTTTAFEFKCNAEAMMFALKFVDTVTPANNYSIAIFYDNEDGGSDDDKKFQFYMNLGGESFANAVETDLANDLKKVWISSGKPDENGSGDGNGYRVAAIMHDDSTLSAFADDTIDVMHAARIGDTAVSGGGAPDQGVPYRGCFTNVDQDPANVTASTLCGTDTLSPFTAIGLTGLGSFGTKDVYDNVPAGIDGLL